MASNSNTLPVIALIIGIAGLSLGGYVILTNIIFQTPGEINPVARVYFVGGGYTINDGEEDWFDFNQKSFDSHDAFNLTSNAYTIPLTGFYHISAQYTIYALDGELFRIRVYQNGIRVSQETHTASVNTASFSVSVTDIINATAGDVILIQYNIVTGATREILGGKAYNFLSIARIA